MGELLAVCVGQNTRFNGFFKLFAYLYARIFYVSGLTYPLPSAGDIVGRLRTKLKDLGDSVA